MALQDTDLFVVDRGGTNYKMNASQLTAKTSSSGASLLPQGTTAQQPSPAAAGMARINTDYPVDTFEIYDTVTSSWRPVELAPIKEPLPDLVISSNGVLPTVGTYENITINAGVTVTTTAFSQLYARTSITINGTIEGNARGLSTIISAASSFLASPNFNGVGRESSSFLYYLGTSGQAGQLLGSDAGGAVQSRGGNAGATVIFICGGTINVGPSAQITMRGQDGTAGALLPQGTMNSVGGASGGSGGLILLQAQSSITLASGCDLNVRGGVGVNGVRGTTSITAAGGGGGGGGGYLVFNTPRFVNNGALLTIGGGAAGANTGSTGATFYIIGGAGGGFGGYGGTAGSVVPLSPANPGNIGKIIYNQYI